VGAGTNGVPGASAMTDGVDFCTAGTHT